MASKSQPMIKLEPGCEPPILSCNVPEPTSYSGTNLIQLEQFSDEYFKPSVKEKPPKTTRTPLKDIDSSTAKGAVLSSMKTGFSDRKLFPNIKMTTGTLRIMETTEPVSEVVSAIPASSILTKVNVDEVASMMVAGKRLNIYRTMYGSLSYNYIDDPIVVTPRLYLVETYRLSSFLGVYGAGKTIKTFSLFPGEKTRISVKTYAKRETDAKDASSILDSFTQESSDDFENSVQSEVSDKKNYDKSFEYHAEAEANASWGFGSAKVSGGVKGGTHSAREEFAKNVSNATQKHAAKASAKRDVQINTSYEVKEETGEETSIEREIQNINVSRTLNLVFRQMNQEFISILHLVDVRVAFFNGFSESKREVPLPELDSLIDEVIINDDVKRKQVHDFIVRELQNIFDYKDDLNTFIEEKIYNDNGGSEIARYLRTKKGYTSTYKDEVTGTELVVPGIILSVVKSVLRTEGVIVEALLGTGDALDNYATRLQELEVARRETEVALANAKKETALLINELANNSNADGAKILAELTCPCGPASIPLEVRIKKEQQQQQ
ncbi:MAG TPA: hypothetical protein VH500_14115 [Nitrososphaeraceae archaeon]